MINSILDPQRYIVQYAVGRGAFVTDASQHIVYYISSADKGRLSEELLDNIKKQGNTFLLGGCPHYISLKQAIPMAEIKVSSLDSHVHLLKRLRRIELNDPGAYDANVKLKNLLQNAPAVDACEELLNTGADEKILIDYLHRAPKHEVESLLPLLMRRNGEQRALEIPRIKTLIQELVTKTSMIDFCVQLSHREYRVNALLLGILSPFFKCAISFAASPILNLSETEREIPGLAVALDRLLVAPHKIKEQEIDREDILTGYYLKKIEAYLCLPSVGELDKPLHLLCDLLLHASIEELPGRLKRVSAIKNLGDFIIQNLIAEIAFIREWDQDTLNTLLEAFIDNSILHNKKIKFSIREIKSQIVQQILLKKIIFEYPVRETTTEEIFNFLVKECSLSYRLELVKLIQQKWLPERVREGDLTTFQNAIKVADMLENRFGVPFFQDFETLQRPELNPDCVNLSTLITESATDDIRCNKAYLALRGLDFDRSGEVIPAALHKELILLAYTAGASLVSDGRLEEYINSGALSFLFKLASDCPDTEFSRRFSGGLVRVVSESLSNESWYSRIFGNSYQLKNLLRFDGYKLTDLDLSFSHKNISDALPLIVENCPNIERLRMPSTPLTTYERSIWLREIVKLDRLKVWDIGYSEILNQVNFDLNPFSAALKTACIKNKFSINKCIKIPFGLIDGPEILNHAKHLVVYENTRPHKTSSPMYKARSVEFIGIDFRILSVVIYADTAHIKSCILSPGSFFKRNHAKTAILENCCLDDCKNDIPKIDNRIVFIRCKFLSGIPIPDGTLHPTFDKSVDDYVNRRRK